MQSFVEELVLCVAANGGRGPLCCGPRILPALLELPHRFRTDPSVWWR